MQIFISTHHDRRSFVDPDNPEGDPVDVPTDNLDAPVDVTDDITVLGGVWKTLAGPRNSGVPGLQGHLPPKFGGLATPNMNPMSMQLSHEEVVVGCADGTI